MNRDKQIQKVNNIYNTMCCLVIYNDQINLNRMIDKLKEEVEKLKL